jgi:hypothetical protein
VPVSLEAPFKISLQYSLTAFLNGIFTYFGLSKTPCKNFCIPGALANTPIALLKTFGATALMAGLNNNVAKISPPASIVPLIFPVVSANCHACS